VPVLCSPHILYTYLQGSEVARRAAREALDDKTINQYSPQSGSEELRREISSFYSRRHGTTLDAASEIVVTSSGQEALAASFLALLDPGAQFTCFTSTHVQILTPEALRARRRGAYVRAFLSIPCGCNPNGRRHSSRGAADRYSVCLLYYYKSSTNVQMLTPEVQCEWLAALLARCR